MTDEALVFLVLIVLILGILPTWPYSKSWGYGPTSGLALVLAILLIWVLAGGRPLFRSTDQDVRPTMQDAGHDLQSAGRNAADSIRNAFQ